jgi:hypothetical protein
MTVCSRFAPMNIELWHVPRVKPYPNNPRFNDAAARGRPLTYSVSFVSTWRYSW